MVLILSNCVEPARHKWQLYLLALPGILFLYDFRCSNFIKLREPKMDEI
ncbi:hypothetical protein HMPREF9412_5178 [Paenibacillus sp. HGF5]|nr:hypothetical protein HMPREF9412_5178 [Paenibacillus sp. HGF5]